MSELLELLRKVADDGTSGSSEIYSKLLDGLLGALAERPTVPEWREFSDGLAKVKRSMAPLQNVAGSIRVLLNAQIPEEQFNGFMRGFLNDLAERERLAPSRIAEGLLSSYRPAKVVTLSYSGTVLRSLMALPRGTAVSVAESLPMGEGAITCQRLIGNGIDAKLFRDSMIVRETASADIALVGADGVCPEGVVNKVGTYPLALAAKECGKPFVVLCSTSKLIPVLEMDPGDTETERDGLRLKETVFELTPLSLVTAIVTEEGVLSGEEMRQRLLRDRGNMKVTECQSC
ncbi:MAG TPA: hypothetical protein PLJ11_07245 [Methanomassiliicoccales archaeon]|jgi:translation initiation factor eIF-2B subunit delta|nr:hypothetical protein [Methanomassiliicoccales archaeon]